MRRLFVLAFVCGLISVKPVSADTYSYYYYSLEWLVDASDTIVEATLVPSAYKGNPNQSTATVKTVHKVYKQVEKVGVAEKDVLPTHIAGGEGHRVLLFIRPPNKKLEEKERIVYCIYLASDKKDDKTDPFTLLPSHSSAWERLAFSWPRCVAVDQKGKSYNDPDTVIKLVEARIKEDPKRVTPTGKYIKSGPKVDDGDDHNLLVPEAGKPK